MNILFWALTIGVTGKVLLAAGVLIAHTTLAEEHKVDAKVIKTFRLEHTITIIGITLILFGYFMELYFYGFTPFKTCDIETCGAALNAAFSH